MVEFLPQKTGQSQGRRRLVYGLNVALSVLAAFAIVSVLDVIAYRQVHRFDFTSTRRYTLSPQTLAVLKEIDQPYKIVTLLDRPPTNDAGGEVALRLNSASELIDEYAQYGRNLTVEHVDPDDVSQLKDFYATLMARYADRVKPQEDAIQAAQKALLAARKPTEDLNKRIAAFAQSHDLPDGPLRQNLQQIVQILARFRDQDDPNIDQQLAQLLDSPLPRFTDIITSLKTVLENRGDQGFGVIANALSRSTQDQSIPASTKLTLNSLVREIQAIQISLDKALNHLREVAPVDDYDKLLNQLNQRNVVVLLSPQQESVVPVNDMYRPLTDAQAEQIRNDGGIPEPMFQGEERLTGALTSLGLKERPLVVFVYSGGAPPLSPRGGFAQVSDRLRKLNFDIMDWTPLPQANAMGQPMPPTPPPQPKPGQKAVWIILSLAMPNPVADPTAGTGNAQIVKLLDEKLNAGDSALVLTQYTGPLMGEDSPLTSVLGRWGITVQADRMVLHEIVAAQKAPQANSELSIDQWSEELPITKALGGMSGVFFYLSPLLIDPQVAKSNGEEIWPLVTFSGEDLWAERNVNFDNPSAISKDPATAGGPFIAMAAAAKGSTRLIVAGDPYWPTDRITTLGLLGEGSADLTGAVYPANSELFVNSIYWLAGLDRLIAASARSQDIRRVKMIQQPMLRALEWSLLLGMPLAACVTGIAVWMVRRRA